MGTAAMKFGGGFGLLFVIAMVALAMLSSSPAQQASLAIVDQIQPQQAAQIEEANVCTNPTFEEFGEASYEVAEGMWGAAAVQTAGAYWDFEGGMDNMEIVFTAAGHLAVREIEVTGTHAWKKHGSEVSKALKCLASYGSSMALKTFGARDRDGNPMNTNVWLCSDPETGAWYAIVTTMFRDGMSGNKTAILLTAYNVLTQFQKLDDYIGYLKLVWSAKIIPYVIRAGEIVVVPK